MDTSVLVRVSPYRGHPGMFHLEVGDAEEIAATSSIARPSPWPIDASAQELVHALLASPSPAVQELLARLGEFLSAPLLLEIRDPVLQSARWEGITWIPPFDRGWSGMPPRRPVIRYLPRLADAALVPMTMPVDILVIGLVTWSGPQREREPDPIAGPLRHFRAVQASRVDIDRASSLTRSASFDIIHIRSVVRRDEDASAFGPVATPPGITVLHSMLTAGRRLKSRLVIIETDDASLGAAYELGHRVLQRGGPTVIVANTNGFDFRQFYYDLTHNWLLSNAFLSASQTTVNALLMGKGGDEVLLLDRAAEAVQVRAEVELERTQHALAILAEGRRVTAWSAATGSAEAVWQSTAAEIEAVRDLVYTYDRESAGMEPMSEATSRLDAALWNVATRQALTRRVVNAWFVDGRRNVPASHALAADTEYRLVVNVGVPTSRSIVADAIGLPEEDLEPYYEGGQLSLRVILFSAEFEIPTAEQLLMLPAPPAESEPVEFAVVTPSTAGDAQLRVAVYHDNNLLQSLLITAVIANVETENGRGNRAVVEWALSADLRNFDRFGFKAVNFLTNETLRSTHLFAIVGDGFSQQLEMEPTELKTKIEEARGALQWVCGDPEKKEPYRFEADNRGDGHEFREHMSGLAELGYDLYAKLILDQGDDFKCELQAALAQPAQIQVARMRSAKFVFPWALVYDHPFVPHRNNRVCPEFEATLASGATANVLAEHRCIAQGCPHRDDTNVACPSGFWGFRHVIEQPLSIAEDPAQDRSTTSDAVDTIDVAINQPVRILNPYSKNLKFYEQHRQEVETLPGVWTEADFDLLRIGKGLQRGDLDVVYFYCHGGNRRGKAWLGVGARPPEELYASNLMAWEVRWPNRHPLVVINGCNTVGISPDDLLTFNEMLAWSKAAGVLGSEITIPETLGRDFGRRFLERFVAGRHIGELVRELRLELLAGFNPLGLAYTPYCLAKLHIARG